jgi:hypothetical protein
VRLGSIEEMIKRGGGGGIRLRWLGGFGRAVLEGLFKWVGLEVELGLDLGKTGPGIGQRWSTANGHHGAIF